MSNPIATPLVEDIDTGELDGLIRLDTLADGAVAVTLLRPALNGAVAAALMEAFETLHGADHVRIVFLKGAGKTFCTGVDPAWLKVAASDWTEAELRDEGLRVMGMLRALTAIPALTVALIEGEAIGGGAGLAAACDLAVATADARFAFPEVTHGAVAALVAPFVVNAVGPRQAKALFATGRAFNAAYAEKIGLIQEIVEDGEGTQGRRGSADRTGLGRRARRRGREQAHGLACVGRGSGPRPAAGHGAPLRPQPLQRGRPRRPGGRP